MSRINYDDLDIIESFVLPLEEMSGYTIEQFTEELDLIVNEKFTRNYDEMIFEYEYIENFGPIFNLSTYRYKTNEEKDQEKVDKFEKIYNFLLENFPEDQEKLNEIWDGRDVGDFMDEVNRLLYS